MALDHDALASSLAGHLVGTDRMVWQDMQLGPSGTVRPDVFTLDKSYAHPLAMSYECKVSRADFRSDVTSGKWQKYLRFSAGVVFAVEAKLIDEREVPEHCGLIVLTDGERWRIRKKPVLNAAWEMPKTAWLKLLIDGVERQGASAIRRRAAKDWHYTDLLEKRHGAIIAKTIRARLDVEHEIEIAKSQADRIVKTAHDAAEAIRIQAKRTDEAMPGLRAFLCEVLGLQEDADQWQIRRAVATIQAALRQHPTEARLQDLTHAVRQAIERFGFEPGKDPDADVSE